VWGKQWPNAVQLQADVFIGDVLDEIKTGIDALLHAAYGNELRNTSVLIETAAQNLAKDCSLHVFVQSGQEVASSHHRVSKPHLSALSTASKPRATHKASRRVPARTKEAHAPDSEELEAWVRSLARCRVEAGILTVNHLRSPLTQAAARIIVKAYLKVCPGLRLEASFATDKPLSRYLLALAATVVRDNQSPLLLIPTDV
jgi:hypothetical protein